MADLDEWEGRIRDLIADRQPLSAHDAAVLLKLLDEARAHVGNAGFFDTPRCFIPLRFSLHVLTVQDFDSDRGDRTLLLLGRNPDGLVASALAFKQAAAAALEKARRFADG